MHMLSASFVAPPSTAWAGTRPKAATAPVSMQYREDCYDGRCYGGGSVRREMLMRQQSMFNNPSDMYSSGRGRYDMGGRYGGGMYGGRGMYGGSLYGGGMYGGNYGSGMYGYDGYGMGGYGMGGYMGDYGMTDRYGTSYSVAQGSRNGGRYGGMYSSGYGGYGYGGYGMGGYGMASSGMGGYMGFNMGRGPGRYSYGMGGRYDY